MVTTVLNGKGLIERTVQSMAERQCRGVEYIAVDGGSTDGTVEILRANHAVVTSWTSEPDRGISDAFNKGISAAHGEVIGFLNAGDWYEKEALSRVLEAYQSHPEADVFCGALQFWEEGAPSLLCHSDPSKLEKETSVYHPTVFIKKSAYLKYGLYDEDYKYAMDYELLLRFKRAGAKFFNIEKTLVNMPLDGISYTHWYEGLKEVKRARAKYFSSADVTYHHIRAVAMNVTARALKLSGLRGVYQAYWGSRNKQISSRREQGS